MNRFQVFFFLCLLSGDHLLAQLPMNKDSLLKMLFSAREDTAAVLLFINIGQQYEGPEPEIARYYYQKAGVLSRKIGYQAGVMKYIANYTYILNTEGKYDSSKVLNLEGVALARLMRDSLVLAKALFNLGTSYRYLGEMEKAVAAYQEGGALFEKVGSKETEAQANDILQNLYLTLGQYDKGIAYGKRSIAQFRALGNDALLGRALSNLSTLYLKRNQTDTARLLLMEALPLTKSAGDQFSYLATLMNLCDVCIRTSAYDEMIGYLKIAEPLAREMGSLDGEVIAMRTMAVYNMSTGNYKEAYKNARKSLQIAEANNLRIEKRGTLAVLTNIAYALHNMKEAETYQLQIDLISDTLLNETIQKNTADLEKKYETQKKELQINQLVADKKVQLLNLERKNTLNYMLIASALILLLVSVLGFRNYQQKQKIHRQRISELETEKQLMATEAVLKGEEQERSRLAKDLHDGLGGMLSGIKHSFTNMQGNLIMTPENAQAFGRSIDMLDTSISELRRVAHNMMPEALVKFGLNTALKDYCHDINRSGALQVSYQSIGMEGNETDQTTSVTIFRIIQELVSNALKHAAATSMIVQLSRSGDEMQVTVEDDGKGFDTALLTHARGIGWANIRSRVEFLKGKMDVQSEPGNGTSVHIEFKVK